MKPDVGSLIESLLHTAIPPVISSAAARFERSEDGWGELTPSAAVASGVQYSPNLEATRGGSAPAVTAIVPANDLPQVTTPGPKATPEVTPPPAMTYSGFTLRPVPVTSVRVLTIDGKPTTVSSIVNYRYVAGSATLQVGSPTTINSVVVPMSIDSSGSTVLVAGDQTTTLAPPVRRLQGAQATTVLQAVKISTTVIQGTTKYVLADQTLAPGQAITINDVPISLLVQSQTTILVVGDATTTLAGGPVTLTTTEWGASAATTFGAGSGDGNRQRAATSSNAGVGSPRTKSWLLTNIIAVAAFVRPFV